jgi:hypothetical protein
MYRKMAHADSKEDDDSKKRIEHSIISQTRAISSKYKVLIYLSIFVLVVALIHQLSSLYDRYINRQARLKVLTEHISGISVSALIETAHKYGFKRDLEDVIKSSIKLHAKSHVEEKRKADRMINRMLCVTFTNADEDSLCTLTKRLQSMIDSCDWIIYVFGGNMTLADEFNAQIPSLTLPYSNRIVNFAYNMSRSDILLQYGIFPEAELEEVRSAVLRLPYNQKIFPKPMLMATLIPLLDQYQYTWIFDGDISISSVNITHVLHNLQCAFAHTPYVAQPLVYEDTQAYDYLNLKSWSSYPDVIAAATGFIEIQAPIFQSSFLAWYLKNIVGRAMWPTHILGADWGYDSIFCKSASIFAEEILLEEYGQGTRAIPEELQQLINSTETSSKSQTFQSYLNSRNIEHMKREMIRKDLVSCAVIVEGTPVRHFDQRAIDRSMGYQIRKALNHELTAILKQLYPGFMQRGLEASCNPLDSSSKYHHQISRDYVSACKATQPVRHRYYG